MSIDKSNRSGNGENPTARRTSSKSRRTSPKESATDPPKPDVVVETTKAAEIVTHTKAPEVIEAPSPIEEIPDNSKAPILEESPSEVPVAETASDNVDIHEGEVMETGNDKKTASLTPAKEGQLVAQPSNSSLVADRVVSTITIAGGKRPIMASNLIVKDMLTANRPIFASDLQIYETINVSGIRPVLASPFHIVGSLDAAGHRPVGADEFEITGTINVSGIRPIGASALHVTEMLTASRPIASNDIDDSGTLMGFID